MKYIFLLGGRDLEMLEIKNLLVQQNEMHFDIELSWDNANWLAYSEVFENPEFSSKTFVGIELDGKENMPEGNIDHHSLYLMQVHQLNKLHNILN
jgi:hypothetical protein